MIFLNPMRIEVQRWTASCDFCQALSFIETRPDDSTTLTITETTDPSFNGGFPQWRMVDYMDEEAFKTALLKKYGWQTVALYGRTLWVCPACQSRKANHSIPERENQ